VFDDYAHHPTEIAALLAGARPVADGGKVLVLFQPHLYSRTKAFATEFGKALQEADYAIVTGIYKAREEVDPTISSRTITETVGVKNLVSQEDKLLAAKQIAAAAQPGDIVITVGAGDVTELAEVILTELQQPKV
jgi:UDP-N-acetylmuramate--alanine ligase